MLLFIIKSIILSIASKMISKHLMLLFIRNNSYIHKPDTISKHLMLLFILQEVLLMQLLVYFKTSHVIVYHICDCGYGSYQLFQNISCYCLSSVLHIGVSDYGGFQNISCYCLSEEFKSVGLELTEFQNISCYCLSMP